MISALDLLHLRHGHDTRAKQRPKFLLLKTTLLSESQVDLILQRVFVVLENQSNLIECGTKSIFSSRFHILQRQRVLVFVRHLLQTLNVALLVVLS